MKRFITLLAPFLLAGCAMFNSSPESAAPDAAPDSMQTATQPPVRAVPVGTAAEGSLAHLLSWFPGEYDNYEQFWLQTVELPEAQRPADPHEHTHHIFAPVAAPLLGEHVFFVKQTLPQKANAVYRQRLYRFSEEADGSMRMAIYSFKNEAKFTDAERKPEVFKQLTLNDLKQIEGCEVRWFWNGTDTFDGSVNRRTCRVFSERLGSNVFVEDRFKLTESALWIREAATDEKGASVYGRVEPHKNRKLRFFEGWAAIKKEGRDAPRESKNWYGTRGIVVHSEGQYFALVKDDGTPAGYSIQLARLTYQNTQQPILKLALVDDATGRSIAYSWAEIDATRIGINLGWIQAGLTLKKDRPQWSW